jgi:hypothetical protein
MLKTLALSASVLAFASGLALAETTLSTGQWLASHVYKASVYDPSDQKIGNVTNLVIDSNGNVTAAIDELMTAPAYNNTGAPSDYRNR